MTPNLSLYPRGTLYTYLRFRAGFARGTEELRPCCRITRFCERLWQVQTVSSFLRGLLFPFQPQLADKTYAQLQGAQPETWRE